MTTSFEGYKERKRKEDIKNIEIIDNADFEAIEREEERIIREALGLPQKETDINYDLCRKHDREEYEKFQKASDRLLAKMRKNPDAYLN